MNTTLLIMAAGIGSRFGTGIKGYQSKLSATGGIRLENKVMPLRGLMLCLMNGAHRITDSSITRIRSLPPKVPAAVKVGAIKIPG